MENIKNNNQINKLNLPTIWTKKKIASLFLLTLAGVEKVKAGQAFKNCLSYEENDTTSYNSLLKFDFASNSVINNGEILNLCECENGNCSSCDWSSTSIICIKIDSLIFCNRHDGNPCRGIIGNTLITTNSSADRSDDYCSISKLNAIANVLATVPASNLTGLEQGYAYYVCSSGTACSSSSYCDWDNDGWTCSLFGRHANSTCLLQWPAPWPGSADKNPSIFTFVPSSSVTSSSSATFSFIPPNNSYLTEKIAIPIGTIVGTITIGGITYYCLIHRKKKKVLLIAGSSEGENNQEVNNEVISDIIQQSEIQEIIANPVIRDEQVEEITDKQQLFELLVQQTKSKIGTNLELALETLLDTQAEIVRGNNTYGIRKDQREAKRELQDKLSIEEINNLCQLQSEVVQSQELISQIEQSTK